MDTVSDTYIMEAKIAKFLYDILGFKVTTNIHSINRKANTCNVSIEPLSTSLTNVNEIMEKGQKIYDLLKKTNILLTSFIDGHDYITVATFPNEDDDIDSLLTLIKIQKGD